MKEYDIDAITDINLLISNKGEHFDCEFHEDDGNAFVEENCYCCNCCGIRLTPSQYLSQIKGTSRAESLAYLYRLNRQSIPSSIIEMVKPNMQLIKVNTEIAEICHRALYEDWNMAKDARNYLGENRKISTESINSFKLGFFPGEQKFLKSLINKFGETTLKELGVIMEGEHGDFSIYKNRVIFPIKNALGQISGFGSRRLDKEKKNKYINSPQSAVFNKSELLYSTPCKPKGIAVITEGYMDVISCSQNDDSNTYYASLGVALNSGNVREVLRKHERVVICADGDSAGIKATQKFIKNNLHNLDVNRIGFVILDEGMDPDDFIKKNGITSFIEKLESPLSAKDFIDLSLDNNEGLQALESYDQYRL